MILYLVRHAVAMEREDWDKSDDLRPLTDEGIERMKEAAEGLARLGVKVDRVMTSPLTRARQTADILVKELHLPKHEFLESLSCGYPAPYILKALDDLPAGEDVMLVGHEPDMGHLAAILIGAARPVPFKKGAVMAIEFDGRAGQGKGRMMWHMPTKILRHLK